MTIQSSPSKAPEQAGRTALGGRNTIVLSAIILLAGLFVGLNLKTAMSVAPWIDEVMQVDAGINLYLGNGWISTAWPQQSQHEFWAANNPLYTMMVYCWVAIWGFSPVAVRSLNCILVLITTWVLVDGCRRAGLLQSLWARLLLAVLIVCNQAVTFVYRTGRADLVTMLVVTLLFWVYVSIPDPSRRRNFLFLSSTLLLPSGLHAIPYTVILLALDYALFKKHPIQDWKTRIQDLLAILLGCTAGGLLMAMFFLWKHSLVAYVYQTFASSYNILGSAALALVARDAVAVNRFLGQVKALSPVNVLRVISQDASILPLILFLLYLLFLRIRYPARFPAKSIAVAGLIAAILVPYGMLAAGRYAFYYAWMGAVPPIVAFTVCVERCARGRQQFALAGGLLAGIASVALGMPSEVYRQVQAAHPAQYAAVENLVTQETKAGDALYGNPILYYAAKARGIPFVTITYATGRAYPRMTEEERSLISVLAVMPEEVDKSIEKLGGTWSRDKVYRLPYGFSLVVCRRAKALSNLSRPGAHH